MTTVTRIAKGRSPGRLVERLSDSVRWAAALGCFGAVYVSVDEAVRTLLGCGRYALGLARTSISMCEHAAPTVAYHMVTVAFVNIHS